MNLKVSLTKYLLPLGAIFMLVIGFITIWRTNFERKITKLNNIVTVQIVEAPKSCENIRSRGGYYKLSYKGIIYSKKAGNQFCYLLEGKSEVQMLSNKNGTEIIFPEEYQFRDFIFGIFICLIATVIFFKGIKATRIKQSKF